MKIQTRKFETTRIYIFPHLSHLIWVQGGIAGWNERQEGEGKEGKVVLLRTLPDPHRWVCASTAAGEGHDAEDGDEVVQLLLVRDHLVLAGNPPTLNLYIESSWSKERLWWCDTFKAANLFNFSPSRSLCDAHRLCSIKIFNWNIFSLLKIILTLKIHRKRPWIILRKIRFQKI